MFDSLPCVLTCLAARRPTDTADAIKSVATISANNDPEIGGLLSRAMSLVGAEGVITVQDGKTMTHEIGALIR